MADVQMTYDEVVAGWAETLADLAEAKAQHNEFVKIMAQQLFTLGAVRDEQERRAEAAETALWAILAVDPARMVLARDDMRRIANDYFLTQERENKMAESEVASPPQQMEAAWSLIERVTTELEAWNVGRGERYSGTVALTVQQLKKALAMKATAIGGRDAEYTGSG